MHGLLEINETWDFVVKCLQMLRKKQLERLYNFMNILEKSI